MSFEFSEVKRKRALGLQLASMIDIFTLIIIFLLMGTVLGGTSISFPDGMAPAKSISKESVEAAPQVVIDKNKVVLSVINKEFPLSFFSDPNEKSFEDLKAAVSSYIKNADNQSKVTVINLNVIADKSLPYRSVYNVVKVLRQSGFQSILFVAEGEKVQ